MGPTHCRLSAEGHAALTLARAQGWTDVVRLLTGERRPDDLAEQPGRAHDASDPAVDRLAEAAEKGQVDEALALLGKSVDANARGGGRREALTLAGGRRER